MEVHDNLGVQVGDHNTLHVNLPPLAPVEWPVRAGVLPPVADRYQHREAESALTGMSGVVLTGLGGVGKSQLAARHAHAAWRDESVDLVVWIAAVTRVAVISGYADAAGRVLRDPGGTPEDATAAFRTWLSSTDRRWLIVLDDVQEPADLRGLWPPNTPTGQVVVTTRRRDAALSRDDRRLVVVGVFTEAESLAYLTAKLPGHEQLPALASDLGHLPLALAQAAAFIADKPLLTVADYRKRLADRRSLAQVLPMEGELPDEHQATVAATWSLSIERADALRPAGLARPLLEIISLLDPAGTPVVVLTRGNVLAHLDVDADAVGDALGCLHRLSLITLDTGTIQAHALLQRAVRDTVEPERLTALAHLAADALLLAWPPHQTDRALAAALRSAANALHVHTTPALWEPAGHAVLFHAGRSLGDAGLPADAVDYFGELGRQAEHHLGPDHHDSLYTRNAIAYWSGQAGYHVEAVAEYERLVADAVRNIDPEHIDVFAVRANLANQRAEAGDRDGGTAELERILADLIRVLGAEHRRTLTVRNNLAGWRAAAGDREGAVAEFERVVADYLRTVGPRDPDTLAARHNLAGWRAEAGDHARAVAELEHVMADRREVLGPDHPDTLATRHGLAAWRAELGEVATALVDLRELLADQLRVLGPDHPDVGRTRRTVQHWSDVTQDGLEGQLGGADQLGVAAEGRRDDPGPADGT